MTTEPSDEHAGLVRLGEAVRRRRLDLGLSQRAVADRGGPSVRSLNKLEQGEPPRPTGSTLSKLDVALDWIPRTAASLLAGLPLPHAERGAGLYTAEDLELHTQLVQALARAGVSAAQTRSLALPPDGRRTTGSDAIKALIAYLDGLAAERDSD